MCSIRTLITTLTTPLLSPSPLPTAGKISKAIISAPLSNQALSTAPSPRPSPRQPVIAPATSAPRQRYVAPPPNDAQIAAYFAKPAATRRFDIRMDFWTISKILEMERVVEPEPSVVVFAVPIVPVVAVEETNNPPMDIVLFKVDGVSCGGVVSREQAMVEWKNGREDRIREREERRRARIERMSQPSVPSGCEMM
ncbi:hypothetical protein P7C70_g3292, partial [Phenoliferia sp. Uapishka_3]